MPLPKDFDLRNSTIKGVLRIEHIISQSEINDAEGRVREAIEQFDNVLVDFRHPHGWACLAETTTRRPKDNVVTSELSGSSGGDNGYSEKDVCGPLVLLEKDVPASEAANLGIDTIDCWPAANSEKELRYILDYDSPYSGN